MRSRIFLRSTIVFNVTECMFFSFFNVVLVLTTLLLVLIICLFYITYYLVTRTNNMLVLQYYRCTHEISILMACPSQLVWNTKLNTCDYPYRTETSHCAM